MIGGLSSWYILRYSAELIIFTCGTGHRCLEDHRCLLKQEGRHTRMQSWHLLLSRRRCRLVNLVSFFLVCFRRVQPLRAFHCTVEAFSKDAFPFLRIFCLRVRCCSSIPLADMEISAKAEYHKPVRRGQRQRSCAGWVSCAYDLRPAGL